MFWAKFSPVSPQYVNVYITNKHTHTHLLRHKNSYIFIRVSTQNYQTLLFQSSLTPPASSWLISTTPHPTSNTTSNQQPNIDQHLRRPGPHRTSNPTSNSRNIYVPANESRWRRWQHKSASMRYSPTILWFFVCMPSAWARAILPLWSKGEQWFVCSLTIFFGVCGIYFIWFSEQSTMCNKKNNIFKSDFFFEYHV